MGTQETIFREVMALLCLVPAAIGLVFLVGLVEVALGVNPQIEFSNDSILRDLPEASLD